ncbi:MAG: sensory box protein [Acidobacteriales bacterium]|nr:sensory box protein [Terriglobales bacterium]
MKSILIVEDNATNRELISEILKARDYTVIEAEDGEQAMELIGSCQPDLVLTDIHMPTLDGFGLIRRIRDDKLSAKLPVVALTAFAMAGDRENAILSGFDGYVTKPIDLVVLTAEIHRCLKKNEIQSSVDYLTTDSSAATAQRTKVRRAGQ